MSQKPKVELIEGAVTNQYYLYFGDYSVAGIRVTAEGKLVISIRLSDKISSIHLFT